MSCRFPYNLCLVGCCFHEMLSAARSIRVYVPSNLCSRCFVSVHVVEPYISTDSTVARKNFRFKSSVRRDSQMEFILFRAFHALPIRMLTSLSVSATSLPRYTNEYTCLTVSPLRVFIEPSCWNGMNSVFLAFT